MFLVRWWRWAWRSGTARIEEREKLWKREYVFTNHDTCCGAATVASVVIACIVFFSSRIIIIYEVLEQRKSWKSMACIDVIIIMQTNNVYVHFDIRNRWCATPLNAAVIPSAEVCLPGTFRFNIDLAGLKNWIPLHFYFSVLIQSTDATWMGKRRPTDERDDVSNA